MSDRRRHRCRHCQQLKRYLRPRQLCHACFADLAIRRRYPRCQRAPQYGDLCGNRPLPARPTDAPPGSPGRIAALMERAARCESLFHPADARVPDDPVMESW